MGFLAVLADIKNGYFPRLNLPIFSRPSAFFFFPRTAVDDFYEQCDPDKENLCLYGNPDGTWEVQLPAEEVPPELPEPALGINFARDGMQVRVPPYTFNTRCKRKRNPHFYFFSHAHPSSSSGFLSLHSLYCSGKIG